MVAAGHEDLVQSGSEDNALRMPQSSDRADSDAASKVDYFERVITQSRKKKPSGFGGVECEMIETAVNTGQRDLGG